MLEPPFRFLSAALLPRLSDLFLSGCVLVSSRVTLLLQLSWSLFLFREKLCFGAVDTP